MMDALAEKIGMDPVEFRVKNVPAVSQARPNNPPYTSAPASRSASSKGRRSSAGARRSGRPDSRASIRRGVGVAAGLWQGGAGGPPSTIVVKLFADGSVNLNMGASDIGTGTKTVMAMVVAEELGVPLDRIQVEWADTGTTQFATPSGGSKTVPTESPAARAAALDVKQQLLALAAEQLKVPAQELSLKNGEVVSTADPAKKVAINGDQRPSGAAG